ncbi:hypothetical protein JCM10914A_01050 [Paenibacillus sp. JCM 10914]|uniref:hypothetical protein n=1 Tax=Paenibacillus sp. JCM 10914 TaxID=1236974 RepID=UPI0003CC6757|nr:hypothetical protein [Paenibacillus sp. JCM 10914]GAE08476.1 hypothetical protein JCM10914_4774 [Paenibacillus sp. JCM 10914]
MDRDEKFYRRWTRIQARGKARYILIRGTILCLLIYGVWALVTWFFDRDKFGADHFVARYYYYFILYLAYGLFSSYGAWKGQMYRYNNLKYDYEKQGKSLPD